MERVLYMSASTLNKSLEKAKVGMLKELAEKYPDYEVLEWKVHDEPPSFLDIKRVVCKFKTNIAEE